MGRATFLILLYIGIIGVLFAPDRWQRTASAASTASCRASVATVLFSPNGKTVLTSGNSTNFRGVFDYPIKLWDVQSGVLLRTLSGHTDVARNLAFSPDGKTILT